MSLSNVLPFLLLFTLTLPLRAQTPQQAALVVQSGDGRVETACISFTEAEISGLDLLLRSGLDVVTEVQGMGALVCRIGETGCAADDCLCQCKGGGNCTYWSYWNQTDGEWRYAQTGAGRFPVTHGMVQGWSWGPGLVDTAVVPPAVSFSDICQGVATAASATAPDGYPGPSDNTVVAWLPYVAFLAIVALLGLFIWRLRQRSSA